MGGIWPRPRRGLLFERNRATIVVAGKRPLEFLAPFTGTVSAGPNCVAAEGDRLLRNTLSNLALLRRGFFLQRGVARSRDRLRRRRAGNDQHTREGTRRAGTLLLAQASRAAGTRWKKEWHDDVLADLHRPGSDFRQKILGCRYLRYGRGRGRTFHGRDHQARLRPRPESRRHRFRPGSFSHPR